MEQIGRVSALTIMLEPEGRASTSAGAQMYRLPVTIHTSIVFQLDLIIQPSVWSRY